MIQEFCGFFTKTSCFIGLEIKLFIFKYALQQIALVGYINHFHRRREFLLYVGDILEGFGFGDIIHQTSNITEIHLGLQDIFYTIIRNFAKNQDLFLRLLGFGLDGGNRGSQG